MGEDHLASGKIYPKEEADSLYGPVSQSINFTESEIIAYIAQTNNVLMFKFIKDRVIILGNRRKLIYPKDIHYGPEDVFSVFGVSLIQELMSKGSTGTAFIEQREKVITITDGEYTAELVPNCPPVCL